MYSPPDPNKVSIEDMCLFPQPLDNVAVIAQSHEDNALSTLRLNGDDENRVLPIARTTLDHERLRRGISAVSVLPISGSLVSFISAGYDHVVEIWSLGNFEQPPVVGVLDIHHTSLVQSLITVGNHLISGGADNSVRIWDLQAAQSVSTIRTSNSVYQLHRTKSPDVVLAEVSEARNLFLSDYNLS